MDGKTRNTLLFFFLETSTLHWLQVAGVGHFSNSNLSLSARTKHHTVAFLEVRVWSNSVVPKVVARRHLAKSLLTIEWIVNLLLRDVFPPTAWAFSQLASLVLGSIPSAWGGVLLLGKLELHLLPSMKHKGFIEARQQVPGRNDWYKVPQRVSPIQRAVKWNSGKYAIQKHRGVRKWQRCGCFNSLQRRGCDSKYSRKYVPTHLQVPGP